MAEGHRHPESLAKKMRYRPSVTLQQEPAECGLVCLNAAAAIFDIDADIDQLKDEGYISQRGLRVSDVMIAAHRCGLKADALLLDTRSRPSLNDVIIAMADGDHFILIARTRRNQVDVFDPNCGWAWIDYENLLSRLDGLAILLKPMPGYEKRERSRLSVWQWLRSQNGLLRSLLLPYIAGGVAVIFSALVPWLTKDVIDVAAGGQDPGRVLWGVLGVSVVMLLGGLVAFGAAISSGIASVKVGKTLSGDLMERLFGMPLGFFSRQASAGLASRLKAADALRQALIRVGSDILFKVLLALSAAFMAAAISPLLVIAAFTFGVLAVVMDVLLARGRRAKTEVFSITAQRYDVELVEAISCMQPIHLAGVRDHVVDKLLRSYSAMALAEHSMLVRIATCGLYQAMLSVLFQAVVLAIAVLLLAVSAISLGEYVAVTAYALMIFSGISALTRFVQLRDELSYAGARIASILRKKELSFTGVVKTAGQPGEVVLSSIGFSYSVFGEKVLSGVSMNISPGECVVVVAPSGSGKSTLAKIIVGALRPTEGTISVGGVELRHETASAGCSMAAVMQDDCLITGTIYENIDFMRGFSEEEIIAAAKMAQIDAAIQGMPMKYETIISDSFLGLSGGQRQRLLLARALVARARILVLDEPTSSLDSQTERLVFDELSALESTRIVFTHRPEAVTGNNRVICLDKVKKGGRLEVHSADNSVVNLP